MLIGMMLPGCGPTTFTEEPVTKAVEVAAEELSGDAEQLIEDLDVDVEQLSRRVNRCRQDGEDIYYIWIGVRAVHDDPDQAIERLHARWQAAGWAITRFQQRDDRGANLAATDPETGHGYALDSGFDAGPEYIVGTFNTPCYREPTGEVDFGPLD